MRKTALLLVSLFVGSAQSAVIFTEDFNTDGLGTRYTAAGAGGAGLGCCQNWSLNSQDEGNESDVLVGFEGIDFWSGSDLDDSSLPGSFSALTPRDLIMNSVNVGSFTNELLTVGLAASSTLDVGTDFLRILAIDSDTNARTVLDFFDGTSAGSTSGVVLGTTFQDLTYDLSGLGFTNLSIGFEAWTTSNNEVIGIDNIRISGDQTQNSSDVPAPAPLALFGLGMLGLALSRKRNAK